MSSPQLPWRFFSSGLQPVHPAKRCGKRSTSGSMSGHRARASSARGHPYLARRASGPGSPGRCALGPDASLLRRRPALGRGTRLFQPRSVPRKGRARRAAPAGRHGLPDQIGQHCRRLSKNQRSSPENVSGLLFHLQRMLLQPPVRARQPGPALSQAPSGSAQAIPDSGRAESREPPLSGGPSRDAPSRRRPSRRR